MVQKGQTQRQHRDEVKRPIHKLSISQQVTISDDSSPYFVQSKNCENANSGRDIYYQDYWDICNIGSFSPYYHFWTVQKLLFEKYKLCLERKN